MTNSEQQQYDFASSAAQQIAEWLKDDTFLVTLYSDPVSSVDIDSFSVRIRTPVDELLLFNLGRASGWNDIEEQRSLLNAYVRVFRAEKVKQLEVKW